MRLLLVLIALAGSWGGKVLARQIRFTGIHTLPNPLTLLPPTIYYALLGLFLPQLERGTIAAQRQIDGIQPPQALE
jgi:hypothetical protein